MTQTLITIEQADLDALTREMAQIREMLTHATVTPPPRYVTIPEYAAIIGKSTATVRRRISAGELDTKAEGNVTMIRNPNAK